MTIQCLQRGAFGRLPVSAAPLPDEPFLTLTEVASCAIWGAPLAPDQTAGSLRYAYEKYLSELRRSGQKEEPDPIVSREIQRFYRLLSQAVERNEVAIWGCKQTVRTTGETNSTEHEAIDRTYLLVAREHDLFKNELAEAIADDWERKVFDRQWVEVRYRCAKLSRNHAKLILDLVSAERHAEQAPPALMNWPKLNTSRKWQPLHVAIAWVVTRDEDFAARAAADSNFFQRWWYGPTILNAVTAIDDGSIPSLRAEAPCIEHSARGNLLEARWVAAFKAIMEHIRDGEIEASGVAIDDGVVQPAGALPPHCITHTMELDRGSSIIWQGPETSSGRRPRGWNGIQINWAQLLKNYPPPSSETPESECCRWLEDMFRNPPTEGLPKRGILASIAKARFTGLTGRAFVNAWKSAIKATGATHVSRPGRPKKNRTGKSRQET